MKSTKIFVPIIIFCTLASCSRGLKKPEDMPDLYPAVVTFQQDAAPLEKAEVTFYPQETPSGKWTAGATTDENGRCEPWTHGRFRGLPAGTYKIVVAKVLREDGKFYDLVAPKYKVLEKTDLVLEIKPEKNTLLLDLGEPVKIHFVPQGI